jgi:hypothetical protein
LLEVHGFSTKKSDLLKLIEAVLKSIPVNERPPGPERNQKRVKNGFIQGMDKNEPLMEEYITKMTATK